MENIQEIIFEALFLVLTIGGGYIVGRWVVGRIRRNKIRNRINKSNILGDSLAQPMENYGSAVAPGRSSIVENSSGDIRANSLPFNPGKNPVDSLEGK